LAQSFQIAIDLWRHCPYLAKERGKGKGGEKKKKKKSSAFFETIACALTCEGREKRKGRKGRKKKKGISEHNVFPLKIAMKMPGERGRRREKKKTTLFFLATAAG